jgi:hypothetical protein
MGLDNLLEWEYLPFLQAELDVRPSLSSAKSNGSGRSVTRMSPCFSRCSDSLFPKRWPSHRYPVPRTQASSEIISWRRLPLSPYIKPPVGKHLATYYGLLLRKLSWILHID